jgi:pimeloyl-ACP methyl ester carboxylesterase
MTRDDWLEGMSAEIALELEWAEAGEEVLELELVAAQRRMEERMAFDPGSLLGEDVSESDRDFLLRPNVVEAFTRIVAEPSSHGVGGSVDDTLAFSRPWGFDLAAIAVPVLLTYGVKDVAAPVGQGRWLAAHIPTVEVWESQTGGHLPAHRRTRRRPCRPPPTSPPSELAAMSTRSTSRVSDIRFAYLFQQIPDQAVTGRRSPFLNIT